MYGIFKAIGVVATIVFADVISKNPEERKDGLENKEDKVGSALDRAVNFIDKGIDDIKDSLS